MIQPYPYRYGKKEYEGKQEKRGKGNSGLTI